MESNRSSLYDSLAQSDTYTSGSQTKSEKPESRTIRGSEFRDDFDDKSYRERMETYQSYLPPAFHDALLAWAADGRSPKCFVGIYMVVCEGMGRDEVTRRFGVSSRLADPQWCTNFINFIKNHVEDAESYITDR